jgi:hypothetical protein
MECERLGEELMRHPVLSQNIELRYLDSVATREMARMGAESMQ